MNDKRGIGSTIAWIAASLLILIMLVLFLIIAGLIATEKGIFKKNTAEAAALNIKEDFLLTKNLADFLSKETREYLTSNDVRFYSSADAFLETIGKGECYAICAKGISAGIVSKSCNTPLSDNERREASHYNSVCDNKDNRYGEISFVAETAPDAPVKKYSIISVKLARKEK